MLSALRLWSWIALFYVLATSETAIMVSYFFDDIDPDPSNCLPADSGLCNLRSAWLGCQELSNCTISIPYNSSVSMDQTRGSLLLLDQNIIAIDGAGSIVDGGGDGLSRLITYNRNMSLDESIMPTLVVQGLSITGFGADHIWGGAVFIDGTAEVVISNVRFSALTADLGGALFFGNNTQSSIVSSCTFTDCSANTGGAVYASGTVSFTVAYSSFSDCSATDYGGAIALLDHNQGATVLNSTFTACVTVDTVVGSGGGIYIGRYNTYTEVTACTFDFGVAQLSPAVYVSDNNIVGLLQGLLVRNSSGGIGGGVGIEQSNQNFTLQDSGFYTVFASQAAGVYIGYDNEFTTVRNVVIQDAISELGGAVSIGENNKHVLFDQLAISRASAKEGGGFYIEDNNYNITIMDSALRDCFSYFEGGGIYADEGNEYFTIVRTVFERCGSYDYGGAIYAFTGNNHWVLDSVTVLDSSATSGGAVFLETANVNFALTNSVLDGCRADDTGGAVAIFDSNIGVRLVNNTISSAVSGLGAGMWISTGNTGVVLQDNVIQNCTAESGGGVYIDQLNPGVVLLSNTLSGNTAIEYGGGLYANKNNVGLKIAACTVVNNTALLDGGGLYLATDHPQLLITDQRGYETAQTVQSQHPYQAAYPYITGSPRTIYNHTIVVNDATGYVLNFDPQTNINTQDTLTIYADTAKTHVLFKHTGSSGWPGVDLPSLLTTGPTLFISFTGSPQFGRFTHYSDGYYGFTLYVTPVIATPAAPTVIAENTAFRKGGGVFFFGNMEFAVLSNLQVTANRAIDGGGVYLFLSNIGVCLAQCEFSHNTAEGDGAGLLVSSGHFAVQVTASVFTNNTAGQSGGGVVVGSDNGLGDFTSGNAVVFAHCRFASNTAGQGGAFYADSGNILSLTKCAFEGNAGTVSGGAVMLGSQNKVTLSWSQLSRNYARQCGGALASVEDNLVNIVGSNFTRNVAGSLGGAVCLQSSTLLRFSNETAFVANFAVNAGGGIASTHSPLWTVSAGGLVVLRDNTADRGSALFLKSLVASSNSLERIQFVRNIARVGGTVYWLYDSTMTTEPPGLESATVLWENNIAAYGIRIATQAVLLSGPDNYAVTVYSQALTPAIVYALYDHYDQRIPLNGTTLVVPTIYDAANTASCENINPSLAGTDVLGVSFDDGNAEFASLQAFCFPAGQITLNFAAELGETTSLPEVAAKPYYLNSRTVLSFRACEEGETIKSGVCTVCAQGTYSLAASVTTSTACTSCNKIRGVDSCVGSQLYLATGYWRRYNTSNAVQRCPYSLNGCQGGNLTGNAQCGEGYEGPLCTVCSDGYFPNGRVCTSCSNKGALSPLATIYISILVGVCVLGVAYVYYRYTVLAQSSVVHETSCATNAPSEDKQDNQRPTTAGNSYVDSAILWVQARFSVIMVKLKIVVATYQIVTATPYVLSVTLPSNFTSFLHSLGFTNLSLASLLPLQCTTSYNFIDKLVVTTLTPIGIALLIFGAFAVQFAYDSHALHLNPHRRQREMMDRFNALKDRYLNYFFYLTYLVLPSVTTTIFQIFICTNIDPEGENPEDDNLYLTADMRISCTSPYYHKGLVYAVFMILVYPVGVPAMYGYLLYTHRQEIAARDAPLEESETRLILSEAGACQVQREGGARSEAESIAAHTENPMRNGAVKGVGVVVVPLAAGSDMTPVDATRGAPQVSDEESPSASDSPPSPVPARELSAAAARLSFLFESYSPRYWYWELVETSRRLILTAVLSLCGAGSSAQAVLAMLLTLIYLKVYALYRPYTEDTADITAEAGLYQILFTFFGALITMDSLLGSQWNSTVGVLLILLNLAVAYMLFYFEVRKLLSAEDSGQSDGQRVRRDNPPASSSASGTTATDADVSASADIEMTVFTKTV